VDEWFHAFLTLEVDSNEYIIPFIFIPWVFTGLQNPYGYGNSHIYLRSQEVKSGENFTTILVKI
jgi:hypothetical protein